MDLKAYQDSFWGFCVLDARDPPQGVQYPLPFERLYERLKAKGIVEGEKKNELPAESLAVDKSSFLHRTTAHPLRIVCPQREDPLLAMWSGGSLSASSSYRHLTHSLGPSIHSSSSSSTAWRSPPLSAQGSQLLHAQWKRQDLCTTLEFPLGASPRETEEEDRVASAAFIGSPLAVLASLSPTFSAHHTSGEAKKENTSEDTPALRWTRANAARDANRKSKERASSLRATFFGTVEAPHGSRADKALSECKTNPPRKYWTIQRQAWPAIPTTHPSSSACPSPNSPPAASPPSEGSLSPLTSPTLSLIRWQMSVPSPTLSSFCSPLDYLHLYIAADVLGRQQAMQYASGQMHRLRWRRGPLPGVPADRTFGSSTSFPSRHLEDVRERVAGTRRGMPSSDSPDASHAYPLEDAAVPSQDTRMEEETLPHTTTMATSASPTASPGTRLPTAIAPRPPVPMRSAVPSLSSLFSSSASPLPSSPSRSFARPDDPVVAAAAAVGRTPSPSIPPRSTFAASLCGVSPVISHAERCGHKWPWPSPAGRLSPPCSTAASLSPTISPFRPLLTPSAFRSSRAPSPSRASHSFSSSALSRSPSPLLPLATTAAGVCHGSTIIKGEGRVPHRLHTRTTSTPPSHAREAQHAVSSVEAGAVIPSPSATPPSFPGMDDRPPTHSHAIAPAVRHDGASRDAEAYTPDPTSASLFETAAPVGSAPSPPASLVVASTWQDAPVSTAQTTTTTVSPSRFDTSAAQPQEDGRLPSSPHRATRREKTRSANGVLPPAAAAAAAAVAFSHALPPAPSSASEKAPVEAGTWEDVVPTGNPPPGSLAFPCSEERVEQQQWWDRVMRSYPTSMDAKPLPFVSETVTHRNPVPDDTAEDRWKAGHGLPSGEEDLCGTSLFSFSPSSSSLATPSSSLEVLERAFILSEEPDPTHRRGGSGPHGVSAAFDAAVHFGGSHTQRFPPPSSSSSSSSSFRPTVLHANEDWNATEQPHGARETDGEGGGKRNDDEEQQEGMSVHASTTVPTVSRYHARQKADSLLPERLHEEPSASDFFDATYRNAGVSPAGTSMESVRRAEAMTRFSDSQIVSAGRSPSSLVWTRDRRSAVVESALVQLRRREGGCSRDPLEAGWTYGKARLSSLSLSASSLFGWKVVHTKESMAASTAPPPPLPHTPATSVPSSVVGDAVEEDAGHPASAAPQTCRGETMPSRRSGEPSIARGGDVILGGSPTSFTTVCVFREDMQTPSGVRRHPSSLLRQHSLSQGIDSGKYSFFTSPCRDSSGEAYTTMEAMDTTSRSHPTPESSRLPTSCRVSMSLALPPPAWGVRDATHNDQRDKDSHARSPSEAMTLMAGPSEEMCTPHPSRPRLSFTLQGWAPRRKRKPSASCRRSRVKKIVTLHSHLVRSSSFSSTLYKDTSSVHAGSETRERSLFSLQRAESTSSRESLLGSSGEPRSSYTRFSLPPFKRFFVCRSSHGSPQSRSRPSYPPVGTVLRLSSGRLSSSLNVIAPNRGPMRFGGTGAALSLVPSASSSPSFALTEIAMDAGTRDGRENGRRSTAMHAVGDENISAPTLPSVTSSPAMPFGIPDSEEKLSSPPFHPIPAGLEEDVSPTPMCRPSILLSRLPPA